MSLASLNPVIRHIRALASEPLSDGPSDQELLERFIYQKDKSAFANLLRRHGPMVRSVCRRLVAREADADDVFQATFLVLLRKARSIRKRQSVSSWLYG